MTKYIKGKDGKFSGSIGAGKTAVPTPAPTPARPVRPSNSQPSTAEQTHAALIEQGMGSCDECDQPYVLSDREDHCPECGTCWEHCTYGTSHHFDH